MIRLTRAGTVGPVRHVLVAPSKIVSIGDRDAACEVYTEASTNSHFFVKESAADVARLIAAWERRYTVAEVVEKGDLPIFVYMGEGIEMACCDHTRRLRDARIEAEAAK